MTELEKVAVVEGLIRVRTYYDKLVKAAVSKEFKEEKKEEPWRDVGELSDIEKFTTFLGDAVEDYNTQETIVLKADERVLQLINSIKV